MAVTKCYGNIYKIAEKVIINGNKLPAAFNRNSGKTYAADNARKNCPKFFSENPVCKYLTISAPFFVSLIMCPTSV